MISDDIFDTREPTNLNDADLDINMTTEAVAREGFTDVSFTLLSCELRRQSRYTLALMSALVGGGEKQQAAQEKALRRIEKGREWAQTRFFGSPGPKTPVQSFAEFFFGMLLDQLSMIVQDTNIFGRWTSDGESKPQEGSFLPAVALIEKLRRWRDQSSTRQWSWMLVNFQQWYAVGIILIHLPAQPWSSTCEKAWTLAIRTLDEAPPAITTQNPLRQSMVSMVATARQHREEELVRLNVHPSAASCVSSLSDFYAPIATPADLPLDYVNLDPPVASHGAPFEAAVPFCRGMEPPGCSPNGTADNIYAESIGFRNGTHLDLGLPSWSLQTTGDMNTVASSFDRQQTSYVLDFMGGRGVGLATSHETFHLWPQGQFSGHCASTTMPVLERIE